jgi:phytoene dehydrogenase-like protein
VRSAVDPRRRVAIIGAGMTGLVAARELASAGFAVSVYERWPDVGGQASAFDLGNGVWLDRYYHHLFPSDRDMIELLEELLPGELVERLATAATWDDRFALLDRVLARRLRDARTVSPEVVWVWQRLRETHGQARIGALADELGWSRKRLVARCREQLGLAPKPAARLLRFEHARSLAGSMGWGELAFASGFSDQPHLIAEFRSFTGKTPETFLQDAAAVEL